MTGLVEDIFGPSKLHQVEANIERQHVDNTDALHRADPALPGPADQAPAPKSDFLSDVSFGLLGNNNSYLVKAHQDEVNRLKASADQGNIDQNTLLTRLSTISSKYQSMDPENAQIYQAVSKQQLGFDPTHQILHNMQSDADAMKSAQIEQTKNDAAAAFNAQIGVVDSHGQPDIRASAQAWANSDPARLKAAAQKAQWEKEIAGAGKTEAEIKRMDMESAGQVLNPMLQTQTDGIISSALLVVNRPDFQEPKNREHVIALVDANKAAAMNKMNSYFATHLVEPEVRKAYMDQLEQVYKPFYDRATGDMSQIAATARTAKQMKEQTGIDAMTSMPTIARFGEINASQALSGTITNWVTNNKGIASAVTGELQHGLMDNLNTAADVLQGKTTIDQMPDSKKTATLDVLSRALEENTRDPKEANLTTVVNAATGINRTGLTSVVPSDTKQAALRVSTPSYIATMTRAIIEGQPGAVDTAQASLSLTEKALHNNLADLQDNQTRGNRLVKTVYNPNTNQIEILPPTQVSSPRQGGRMAGLEAPPMTPQIDRALINQVNETNQLLRSRLAMRTFQSNRLNNMNPSQLGQYLMDTSGFPNKPGMTKTPYDEELANGIKGVRTANTTNGLLQGMVAEPVQPTSQPGQVDVMSQFDAAATQNTRDLGVGVTGSTGNQATADMPYEQLPSQAAESPATLRDMIAQEADAQGVPRELALAISAVESGGGKINQIGSNIKSPKESDGKFAFGPFQLRAQTAGDFGVDRYNTGENIRGGVALLAQALRNNPNDIDKVIQRFRGVGPEGDKTYYQKVKTLMRKLKEAR